MRIAYLDCFSGISGDMFLGALIDTGVSSQLFEDTVAALKIEARVEISRVQRSGIAATKVDVYAHGEKELPREVYWEQQAHKHAVEHPDSPREHARTHSHSHHPRAALGEKHATAPTAVFEVVEHTPHAHVHGRGLKEIQQIINRAPISEGARHKAVAIFQALGEAEAKVHNTNIELIHFHEVGAVDAMVDIVCAAVGAEALGVDEIVCSPLNVGGGIVKCAHGTLPVPAPATLELLKGAPVFSSGMQVELVTPTGAAIVKVLAQRFSSFPAMSISRIGYGAGSRDFPAHANVARLTVGESLAASLEHKEHPITSQQVICVLETNLDDLNPQLFGYVMDRLFQEGALDVFAVPVQMKKNRPGALLTVLCDPSLAGTLTNLIFTETTTLGVRRRVEDRQSLARRQVTVATQWGEVRMKLASMNGTVTNYAPEYEDCRRIAAEHRVPLKTVMHEAVQKYLAADGPDREARGQ